MERRRFSAASAESAPCGALAARPQSLPWARKGGNAVRDKIKGKLRSRQGMSLLLALLAFLICAVAGSVLLTAGTASSGTISERVKMDRRYFSVTSAAEFLREKFDEKSVSVKVESNEINVPPTFTTTVKIPSAPKGQPNVKIERDENKGWVISSNGEKVSAEENFVIDQSLYLLSELHDADWHYDDSDLQGKAKKWWTDSDKPDKPPYDIAVSSDDPEIKDKTGGLKATLQIQPANSSRTLDFIVTSDINGDDGTYSLKISYSASVVKEEKTTAVGKETVFQVNWKIGAISVAS